MNNEDKDLNNFGITKKVHKIMSEQQKKKKTRKQTQREEEKEERTKIKRSKSKLDAILPRKGIG